MFIFNILSKYKCITIYHYAIHIYIYNTSPVANRGSDNNNLITKIILFVLL